MDADDRSVQLYTLEYQKAAERYENIYRSMWTIFSYLAAVAAGLLTFGSNRIEQHALVCIAALPLLFWFWTTYLPLDRYGNQTVMRLGELEKILNKQFKTELSHFSRYAHPLSIIGSIRRVFKDPYHQSRRPSDAGKLHRAGTILKALWGQIHRARFAIVTFLIVVHWVVWSQASLFYKSGQPLFR